MAPPSSSKPTYFWDSCVFYRFLNATSSAPATDIAQFIADAQANKISILCSTLAFAEIRPSALRKQGYETIDEFFDDMNGVFLPIGPTPEIMKRAAILKDHKYTHATKAARHMSTFDAIQLLTCLHAREDLGLAETVFHTFDDGGGKSWEGKCVPILSFEEWTSGCGHIPLVGKIVAMPRKKPEYEEPPLFAHEPGKKG